MSLSATEIDVRTVLHMFQLVKMKGNPGQWKLQRLQYFVLHYITLLVKQITIFSSYPETMDKHLFYFLRRADS